MTIDLHFPQDEFGAKKRNYDLAADYLELTAFFSDQENSFTQDLINMAEIGAEEDYSDVDEEMTNRGEIVSGAASKIKERHSALEDSYPFTLDASGYVLTYAGKDISYGQVAYILSLILSNLEAVSPLLHGSTVHPSGVEIANLRKYFQYFS